MVRVSLEVREGADSFEVTAHADSIVQAVGGAERRFPGREVRVLFPIDGGRFFDGEGSAGTRTESDHRPELLTGRGR